MTVSELARAVAARQVLGDARVMFTSVSTDTRTLATGALFVALRGERFDGHAYADAAVERGAVALLVEHPVESAVPQIVVADARHALGVGAAQWRARFTLPVIAVTGSNGKTTVTQMIGSIFAQAYGERQRLVTHGNLNNEIGVPLMLWQLSRQHKAAVLELGMNHPGEIATLAEFVRPTVALVNNAQREHQEFMKSVEATAYENGEVIASLPLDESGAAVFPADDPVQRHLAHAGGHAPCGGLCARRRCSRDRDLPTGRRRRHACRWRRQRACSTCGSRCQACTTYATHWPLRRARSLPVWSRRRLPPA